ncbi:hypothetical protein DXG01_015386 [Tephrocybe rancida]|nr:hypothetical protein DXG01_015386 [Tephrocybe rancida]
MRFSTLFPAILVAAAELVLGQSEYPQCWKARNCNDPHWESKENLLSQGKAYCDRLHGQYRYPLYELFNPASAVSTGFFNSSSECVETFGEIVDQCFGKSNGGHMNSITDSTTRLYVSFGDCEEL